MQICHRKERCIVELLSIFSLSSFVNVSFRVPWCLLFTSIIPLSPHTQRCVWHRFVIIIFLFMRTKRAQTIDTESVCESVSEKTKDGWLLNEQNNEEADIRVLGKECR